MGRGFSRHPAPVAWPAYSPDLTPLDYWVWGDMKQRIFTANWTPNTLDDLKARIVEVVEELQEDEALRERAIAEFQRRLQICIDRGGQQVEIR